MSTHSQKNVYTTGEVAKLCNVAPRTVSKWFDSGQLRGYRIPGSKDRRIPQEQLVRFMRSYGIPLNGLDTGARRVLVLDQDESMATAIARALEETGDCEALTAASAMEAGAVAIESSPQVLLIDVSRPDVNPATVVRWARSVSALSESMLIATAPALGAGEGEALLQQGFDAFLSKPFDIQTLRHVMDEHFAPAESG